MIQLTEEELKRLQEIEFDMLLEIKRVCNKNNIKYSLIGGTLLGAIRHKGYIPWDDDADVGMLREDYEKFRMACEIDLDAEKYYFQDDRNTEGYRWGYGKLRRKHTLFLRENQEHLKFGQEIFVDIFPLDYVPDNMLLRKVHAFRCFCIRKMLWAPVGAVSEKNKYVKFIYRKLGKIPKKRIYYYYYKYIIDKKKSNTVRINLFPTCNPYGFPISYFEELIEVEFENEIFMGSKFYDKYLKIKYGDYMKLPPLEERKVHPIVKLKFI